MPLEEVDINRRAMNSNFQLVNTLREFRIKPVWAGVDDIECGFAEMVSLNGIGHDLKKTVSVFPFPRSLMARLEATLWLSKMGFPKVLSLVRATISFARPTLYPAHSPAERTGIGVGGTLTRDKVTVIGTGLNTHNYVISRVRMTDFRIMRGRIS